jgi:hypothetical protein
MTQQTISARKQTQVDVSIPAMQMAAKESPEQKVLKS